MAKHQRTSKSLFKTTPKIYRPHAKPQRSDEQLSLDAFDTFAPVARASTQSPTTKVARQLRRVIETERPKRPRDMKEAIIARDDALARLEESTDSDWAERALRVLETLARTKADVHCDDLWQHIEFPPEARASGAVWQRAARLGYIQRTNELRPSIHSNGSGKPVWRSLLFRLDM